MNKHKYLPVDTPPRHSSLHCVSLTHSLAHTLRHTYTLEYESEKIAANQVQRRVITLTNYRYDQRALSHAHIEKRTKSKHDRFNSAFNKRARYATSVRESQTHLRGKLQIEPLAANIARVVVALSRS